VGIRTEAFADTVGFFRNVLELPVGNRRRQFVRLDLPDWGSVEVFDSASGEYPHFSTGPVVGFEVADFDRARSELENGGCDLLLPPGGEAGEYRWQHFRSPDGCVYEIVDYPSRPAPVAPVGPMGVTKLIWTGVSTAQFDAAARFLRATLGLPVEEETKDLIECRLPDRSSVEAFRRDGPMDHPHFRTGPVPGFGVSSLDRALEVLGKNGVPVIETRRREWGGWAHVRAPDGRVYELKEIAKRLAP
jgi:catechol 2,3-dioxygenase-like lactoylglutathione lyase family enzyme